MINTKMGFVLFSFLVFFLPRISLGATISLSPKDVADLITKQSYRAQELELTAQQARLARAQVKKNYDFLLSAESGYQVSKFESATNTYLLEDNLNTTSVALSKPFATGTTVSLSYLRTFDQPKLSGASPAPASDVATDTVGLIVTQNLLKNTFGNADRADLRAAESSYQAAQVNRDSQLQELVLEAIRSYWNAYVAQQTFQGAQSSRNRYEKLVEQIKKKTGYGYSNPGELAQAQAELEAHQQSAKNSSVVYLAALDSLISLLNLQPGSEIIFKAPEEIPPPPEIKAIDIENLSPLKSAKLKLQAADDNLTATNSKGYPDLSFVGKIYQQGLEQKSQDSFDEMNSGTHPKYYLGLQLQYSFGSGYADEDALNKKTSRDLAEAQLNRSRLELKDKENNLLRRLQSTFAIAQSTKNQKGYREKAAQELSKSYTQGRTDISLLITALNNFFDSEVQFTRSIGDYQTALNEWSAFRDELVTDSKSSH